MYSLNVMVLLILQLGLTNELKHPRMKIFYGNYDISLDISKAIPYRKSKVF